MINKQAVSLVITMVLIVPVFIRNKSPRCQNGPTGSCWVRLNAHIDPSATIYDEINVVNIAPSYGPNGPGIESRWGQNFLTRSDWPCSPPRFLCKGYRFYFLGVNWPGLGQTPKPSSAEVQERVKLHLYSPYVPSWPVIGWTLHFNSWSD